MNSLEIRTVPTTERIGHAYLRGLNTSAALQATWAAIYRRARHASALLSREGDHRGAKALMKNTLLGIKGNQSLAKARELT